MGVKKRPVSPRQKMINLMYVILMAMLALNVSSDVLKGFSLINDSLLHSTDNSTGENNDIYKDFADYMKQNPEKVKAWYAKAMDVKHQADSLYNLVDALKIAIAKEADGEKGNPDDIQKKDDMESVSHVMFGAGSGKGALLHKSVDRFREKILAMITDERQRRIISSNLETTVPKKSTNLGKNWEQYMFESTPAAAAVTLLSKLQSDIRYAEGEVLHTLVANIDMKDIRVNQLDAYVIPNSQTIIRGGKFEARIVMAAIDTTQKPTIYIGGRQANLKDGLYQTVCSSTGEHSLAGYLEMTNASGEKIRRDFNQKYTVIEPSATVSATLMNVLYAGFSNPMSVSVPGVPNNQISATMSGGTLTPTGSGTYIAKPASVGKDAVITVTAKLDGRVQEMGKFTFHVRKLPDPTAYIKLGGTKFKGGSLAKGSLMNADALGAAIDDGLLNIEFKVLGFETVFFDNMGNAVPEVSSGSQFSSRQKEVFRKLGRGKRFYITRIRAVGPDGIERKLPQAVEVILN